MQTLSGADISHDQGQINWQLFKNNVNFVFIQSSYGVGNFDAQYGYNKGQVLLTNLPHGYYHFAYPNLNTALDEAKWFVTALSAIKPLQKGEIIILDYEEEASDGDNVGWVKTFLDYVTAQTGVKPILYTYQDMLQANDFSSVAQEGYGLWIAAPTNDPTNNNFNTYAFKFALAQQWGTEAIPGVSVATDADIFFGTVAEFEAYGYQPIVPPSPITPPAPVTSPMPVVPSVTAPVPPVPPIVKPIPSVSPTPVVIKSTPVLLPSAPPNYPWYKWIWQFFLGNIEG